VCDDFPNRPIARDTDRRAATFTSAPSIGQAITVPRTHNWVEALAVADSTVSNFTVDVLRLEADPETGATIATAIGQLTRTNPAGGGPFHVPPGARVRYDLSSISGSGGAVRVLHTSWAEA
jgi:hypothetical protein